MLNLKLYKNGYGNSINCISDTWIYCDSPCLHWAKGQKDRGDSQEAD